MFIAKNNDLIILAKETREELEQALQFMVYTDIKETDKDYILYNGSYVTEEEKEEQEEQAEKEHIANLYMTRSDFFDNTIKAWGTDDEELLPIIKNILETLGVSDLEKKIAINNYKNALNFYRKHTLFTLLSGIPIPIGDIVINVSSESWDRFFDKVDKRDPEAYKELLPS